MKKWRWLAVARILIEPAWISARIERRRYRRVIAAFKSMATAMEAQLLVIIETQAAFDRMSKAISAHMVYDQIGEAFVAGLASGISAHEVSLPT